MKLVIHPPVDAARLEKIRHVAKGMNVINAINPQQAEREIADADAFFGKIDRPMLAAARRLRWVQSATASLEHYIFPELVEHSCMLTNMRGLYSDVIADQVMGYIICFARNLHRYIRSQMERQWAPVGGENARVSLAAGPGVVSAIDRAHSHLGDATLGIVGLGSIGSEIARRAQAFGMRITAVDPVAVASPPDVILRTPDRLDELLGESDFVAVAAPHTPDTEQLFGRAQFRKMKRTACFINVGRGAIVRLDDLAAALREREIAGAALDVFETEPLPASHPLWQMPNVILTPHIAGYSPRIAERHLALLLDNISRFVNGLPLRNVVNKAKWF
jgi:phosphoglycerate dehydrogenase-like enzyme